MTTASSVCTRALRLLSLLDESEVASGQMLTAALAALNDMMHSWSAAGVNVLHSDYVPSSVVCFYLPPRGVLRQATTDALSYQGEWDAATNTPSLSWSNGTDGHVYKVSVAGNTDLNGITDWQVGQFLTFDGYVWRRSPDWRPHERCVTYNLAVALAPEYGREAPVTVIRTAAQTWIALQGVFMEPRRADVDRALTYLPSARKEW